jgi:hypothetical protein
MTRSIKTSVGAISLVVTMYGEATDAVFRIYRDLADIPTAFDNYAPPADIGYLSFRYADGWPIVSGALDHSVISSSADAARLLYEVIEQLIPTDEQVHCRISLVDTCSTLIQTGEEDIFVKGRA